MTAPVTTTSETFRSYHWIFLALPSPLPETLIGADPDFYMKYTIDSWTGSRFLPARTKGSPHYSTNYVVAFDSWVGQYKNPEVIEGCLEDYRAGVSIDLVHDAEDLGILPASMETLLLYSVHLGKRFDVEGVWENLVRKGRSLAVGDDETGHFLPVEASEQVAKEMKTWLGEIVWRQ